MIAQDEEEETRIISARGLRVLSLFISKMCLHLIVIITDSVTIITIQASYNSLMLSIIV